MRNTFCDHLSPLLSAGLDSAFEMVTLGIAFYGVDNI